MYQTIKGLFPVKLLKRFEQPIRWLLRYYYRGNHYQCPVCNNWYRKFISVNQEESLCPGCGCLPRKRALWVMLKQEIEQTTKRVKVLHFSPTKALSNRFSDLKTDYITGDYEGILSENRLDITDLPFQKNSFDFIICFHILEHIYDDNKAMEELYRVLKPGGKAIIQVPFKQGATIEQETSSDEERIRLFGQKDHVRFYGQNDLIEKLNSKGFVTEPIKVESVFSGEEIARWDLNRNETILISHKEKMISN